MPVPPTNAPVPPPPGGSNAGAPSGGGGGTSGGGGGSEFGDGGGFASVGAFSAPIAQARPPEPQASQRQTAGVTDNATLTTTVDANGGQLASNRVTLTMPADAIESSSAALSLVLLDPAGVPQPSGGFQLGRGAFLIALSDLSTGGLISQFANPMSIDYRFTPDEVNLAGGDLSRLRIATLIDDKWVALSCAATSSALQCLVPHLSMFAVIVAPPHSGAFDVPIADGWFFKQANGFSGAGNLGYPVVDDADASFWSEFQRLGGVDHVGYPISQRFQYGGFVTQAFQRLVLQWHPDLGQAVPMNVFDELGARGSDKWIEQARQVPPGVNTSADIGLSWEDVVLRHLELLDAYPVLRTFYESQPNAITTYGLPLSLKDYGPLITVRLQRGTFQLWTMDMPWATAGTVVLGNAGDVAKEVGLWPLDAMAPSGAPELTAQAP
jgi:hypothetical protein